MNLCSLVTGGCGFIGSHLVDRLCSAGHSVDVVDDLSNGHIEFLAPDLRNENLWISDFASETVLDRVRRGVYDCVFHLAAQPRVSYSVENPAETNDINLTKTVQLLEACRDKVRRVVFASSSAVYGDIDQLPTPADVDLRPRSPYALQKSHVEDYLRLFHDLYGLDSVALRFFNVFGPRQIGGSPYSTAVSAWLTAIMSGQLMRSDGDGSQTRDMCHVDNVVDACIKAASCPSPLRGEAFNVGIGRRVSNREILDVLKTRYPQAAHYDAPPRVGDVKHTLADIRRTKDVLGYEPVVDFWTGLDSTARWYEENWDMIKRLLEDRSK